MYNKIWYFPYISHNIYPQRFNIKTKQTKNNETKYLTDHSILP